MLFSLGHLPCKFFRTFPVQVFHTHTCILVHTCTGIALGYLHTCTWILTLAYLPLDAFVQVQVWKCQCVSVSVEASVFKGFSGRTLRNAFGKISN